jgi:Tfp pilus assembly protein PilZ
MNEEVLEKDFDKDIEEAKTLRDIDRLEKKDFQLRVLSIFVIIVLGLFILVMHFESLHFSPVEILNQIKSFRFPGLIFPAVFLLLVFCGCILYHNWKIRHLRREIFIHKIKLERSISNMEEITALFQISSAVDHHKDFSSLLEMIARESRGCLRAHRSTLFLMEDKSGVLKTQCTYASDPLHEQVGVFEEKEMARKALRQRKPFLLREPRDFSEFFKYDERSRKITSLMNIPLVSQGKSIGVLSVVMIDEDQKFTERDLQFLLILGNQVSISMENSILLGELRDGASFRKSYEQYLDHILNQLQTLSDVERRRIEDHIGKLMPAQAPGGKVPLSEQAEVVEKGAIPPLLEQIGLVPSEVERETRMLKVDLEGEPMAITQDLGDGAVFIRTPNPLDLGEQFLLKLHLGDGEEPIDVTCKVVWTNKYGKESRHLRRGMGVKFLNLSPVLQNRVEGYIKSHKDRQFTLAEDKHHLSMEG